MSGAKLDVIWAPVHHNKFIVWSSDITLYEVARLKDIEKNTTFSQISSTRGAIVVASQSASSVRCVDISAIPDQPEPLLALGHTNGRVSLTTLKQTYDPLGLVGKEFVPRYPRLCNSVAWSHVETNLLAVALEKYRNDHCILLWDVNQSPSTSNEARAGADVQSPPEQKPFAEMGLSETAHNVSWTASTDRTLLASMNMKHIKIFDLRDLSKKEVSVASTRYCYGACADPFSPWQIASRGDNVVCVWDARNLERPLLSLPQPRPVLKIQWCPTRRNLLMSLQRDSSSIRLHDIQQANESKLNSVDVAAAVEAELEEFSRGPSVLERDVTPAQGSGAASAPPPAAALAAACCHPQHAARLLAHTDTGNMIDYTVCERVTVGWGAGGLVWSSGGGALRLMPDHFYAAVRDVSYVMKGRAHSDYGLKPDLWQNADLADDEALSALWHFLALSKSLVEDGCIRNSPWRHPGVLSVLTDGGYRSELVPSLLPDLPNRRVAVYRSCERSRALQLCGWGWGWDNAVAGVERAEAEGTPCRAAALAAFHLRLRTALDVLARAREPQLRVVALALAGLSEERLWREALAAATPALPDAYLRALLHFLAASAPAAPPHALHAAPKLHDEPHLREVLAETEMRLEDRVAFACIFLSDSALHEYVKTTSAALVQQGDLSGMLLTGASTEGVALLQRWLENTGDVQSCALIAARCFTVELLREASVQNWLDSYRCVLDSWRLWWARCALDTLVAAAEGAAAGGGARLVCAACSYCGKAVAAPHHRPRPQPRLPPPAAKMKMSSCPHCRKPLPRCGVCTLHLGTASGAAAFPAWFSWCVGCRHGGHAHHLLQWFQDHAECPVSSCGCRCAALDAPARL
ncbi:GATOR2 complex protein MIOS isoform X2 [Plodia interpunctella]|uniref:GATOR2 complex protein MIOS isoform X2 n=1 Tax=Plodia interpunctella TaxID=58824 RepID=UPI002368987A|nr:GATOR complex protein MIOS isoform X2 [Plodia interpunctella]